MKKFNKIFAFTAFVLICSTCYIQQNQTKQLDSNFSSDLWCSDTLGGKSYRLQVVKNSNLRDWLVGKRMQEVEHLLGDPDFLCSEKNETTFQYNIEYRVFGDKGDRDYFYKPRQNCTENYDLGSVFSVVFDKRGNVTICLITYRE